MSLSDYVYCMGYSRTSLSGGTCGWYDFQKKWCVIFRAHIVGAVLRATAWGWKDAAEGKAPTVVVAR
jgi:hypothetical protein